jgi:transposase-like protein
MAKKARSEEQILRALHQAESGERVADICREHGVSEATFYVWKKKYSGVALNELRELRQLREENGKLKRLVADLSLDRHILLPLKIEPPIVQRSKGPRGGKWQTSKGQKRFQRWTAKRRAALVLSLLKGETTAAEAARRHGLKVAEVEDWRDRFLLGAENALRARPKEDEALREEELNRFKRKVGELTIDLDILRTADRLRPMTPGTSDE